MLKTIATVASGLLLAPPAWGACYDVTLRTEHGRVVYDGDTVYVTIPGVWPELSDMSIRILSVDAPEVDAHCDEERYQATAARDYLDHLLRTAGRVEVCEPQWDKYGGRVLGRLRADGQDVAPLMIAKGFARPYGGGQRGGWCE